MNLTNPVQLVSDSAKRLFQSAIQIGDRLSELADRRLAVLKLLIELTQASAGHWSWGHGNGDENMVMPIAVIPAGFSEQQMAGFIKISLTPELYADFIEPIKKLK